MLLPPLPLLEVYDGIGCDRSQAVAGDWIGRVQRSRSITGEVGVICAFRAESERVVNSGLYEAGALDVLLWNTDLTSCSVVAAPNEWPAKLMEPGS